VSLWASRYASGHFLTSGVPVPGVIFAIFWKNLEKQSKKSDFFYMCPTAAELSFASFLESRESRRRFLQVFLQKL
jgi:hypothetical protein